MGIAETSQCPFTPAQVVIKAFNNVFRAQSFPDIETMQCKRKEDIDNMWGNFKTHFSREIRDYQKDQGLTAKSVRDSETTTNQSLLQAQYDFREVTESVAKGIIFFFEEVLNITKISTTKQQEHAAVSSANSSNQNGMCQLLAEL